MALTSFAGGGLIWTFAADKRVTANASHWSAAFGGARHRRGTEGRARIVTPSAFFLLLVASYSSSVARTQTRVASAAESTFSLSNTIRRYFSTVRIARFVCV